MKTVKENIFVPSPKEPKKSSQSFQTLYLWVTISEFRLVKVGIWILQSGNQESIIEQFVFVEVRLFFQNAPWLSVPGTRLVFMGYRCSSWISFGVSSAI